MCHFTIFYTCYHAELAKPYSCKCDTIKLNDKNFSRSCDECESSPPYGSNIRDEGRKFKNESCKEARARVAELKDEDESSEEPDGEKTPTMDIKTKRWYFEQQWEASKEDSEQSLKGLGNHKERKDELGSCEDEAQSGSITPRAECWKRK